MDITIVVDDQQVQQRLNRLRLAGANMSAAMRKIANLLQASAERNFDRQADPATGAAWAPLKPSTVARRKKIGKGPTPILEQSGILKKSLTSVHGKDYAVAGTNIVYAAIHQFGAKKGQFTKKQGRPIPWGDIPARPFLGVRDQELKQIRNVVLDHLRDR